MIGFQVTDWGSTCPNGNKWTGVAQNSNTALYNNANSSHTWGSTITAQKFLPKTTFTYTSGYHVNAGTMSNGSIQFSNDGGISWYDELSNVDAGETVVISVEPDAGYLLSDTPTVTPASGIAPTVSGSGNLYSFVMPESDVTVNATFDCTTPADPTFSVADGTYTTLQNVSISCATAGATIYYTTDGSTPTNSSTQYTGAIAINETTTLKAIAYIGTCTSNEVMANYTMDLPAYTVACATGLTGGSIAASPASAVEGTTITITATTENGYFLATLTATDGNNTDVPVTIDGNSGTFTMPASNVTVTATFTQGFQVTLNQTPNGTISADQTTGLQPGDIVTLTATPDNDCVFLAWYVFKDGNPRDVIALVNNSWFFMPSSNVTVQAVFVTEEEHEQTVGGGSNTNGNLPTNVYYNYSLTQQIYTAAEIGYNGRITAIAFKANESTARTFDVYMAHTSKTAFASTTDWQTMGPSFLVYHGDVSFDDSDWTTITLDTPFEYDGTSNLNICVVDITGEWVNNITFNTYSTSENRAMYVASDGTDYSEGVNDSSISSYTGDRSTVNNQIKFTIKVAGSAESLTISPDAINDFSYWEGQGPSETYKLDIVGVDLENDITITAPTNFEVCLTEDGTYTSSLTIPLETGSKRNRAQTTWEFESDLEGWTAYDVDNDGYYWEHSSVSTNFDAYNSDGCVVSASFINGSVGALTPDNWLVSPQVALGGTFSLYAVAQDQAWPDEHFGIFVSTTGTNPSDFTMLGEWTLAAGDWKQYSVDLEAYAGQNGYIAVRHFNCTDKYNIKVDHFVLDTDAHIEIEMPVTITPATVYVRMKDDLNTGTYSGTLTASAGTEDNLNGSVSLNGEVTAIVLANDADNSEAIAQAIRLCNGGKQIAVQLKDRTLLKNGTWNTLCLPFNVVLEGSPLAGATLMELDTEGTYDGKQTGFDRDGTLYLYFKNAEAIEAGKPYVIKWEDNAGGSVNNNYNTGSINNPNNGGNIENPVFSGVTVSSTQAATIVANNAPLNKVQFIGGYSPMPLKTNDESNLFFGTGYDENDQPVSTLYYPNVDDYYVNAFRAYVQVDLEGAKALRAFVLNFGGEQTGIVSLSKEPESQQADAWYSLDGRRLSHKPTVRGIYVNNGRKVVVK